MTERIILQESAVHKGRVTICCGFGNIFENFFDIGLGRLCVNFACPFFGLYGESLGGLC